MLKLSPRVKFLLFPRKYHGDSGDLHRNQTKSTFCDSVLDGFFRICDQNIPVDTNTGSASFFSLSQPSTAYNSHRNSNNGVCLFWGPTVHNEFSSLALKISAKQIAVFFYFKNEVTAILVILKQTHSPNEVCKASLTKIASAEHE